MCIQASRRAVRPRNRNRRRGDAGSHGASDPPSPSMRRDPTELANTSFDVLIIGGGAFGAAAARDAALRGLRTALIERADFGGGASAECFKMVHGGIRYLQHADLPRLRASCAERSALLRIAPHLV